MFKKISLFLLIAICEIATTAWANLPYYPIQFPRDEAAHYDNVPYPLGNLSEWWYYNGTVTTTDGRKFGYYLNYCFLKYNDLKTVIQYFGLQITDIDNQKVYGQRVFFDAKEAYASTQNLDVTFGKQISLHKENNTFLINATVSDKTGLPLQISLQLTPTREPLFMNETGLTDMWNNTNSYYYSYTHVSTAGTLQIGNDKFTIDTQKSLSWMDHQWGDFVIQPGKTQWLWSDVQLPNGLEINLSVILDKETLQQVGGWADVVLPDNRRVYISDTSKYSYSPHQLPGQKFPLSYELSIPSLNLKLQLDALAPGQNVNTIWEGVSLASGAYNGDQIAGQAWTENSILSD